MWNQAQPPTPDQIRGAIDVEVGDLKPQQSGFEADAFTDGHWFVKLAPREHDLFAALCEPETVRFLRAYGAEGLSLTHLEYARLARSLRDIAVRVVNEVDKHGIDTWGIDGLRRVDADIALARTFCDD